MLAVDLIGLVFTILLVSPRYAHYTLVAAGLHELGRLLMTVFLRANVDTMVAGGMFGTTSIQGAGNSIPQLLIVFAGPLFNYFAGATLGGAEYERTGDLFNPFARLKAPFAVVNMRLALYSAIYHGWHILFR